MCGLVATIGYPPPAPLKLAIALAGRRGPHSSGWATLEPGGERTSPRWTLHRAAGKLSPSVEEPAPLAVGHSRLATSSKEPGALPSAGEGQPLLCSSEEWVLAHNGNSPDPRLTADHLPPSDSRGMLALLVETGDPLCLMYRRDWFSNAPQAALFAHPERGLYAWRLDGLHRPAHPLYATTFEKGLIVSSSPIDRGRPTLLPVGLTHLGGP